MTPARPAAPPQSTAGMGYLLVQGDCRRGIPLADGSVHCVVTSPPYFGLRDYGTATWEGGDPNCDHLMPFSGHIRNEGRDRSASGGTFHDSPIANQIQIQYREVCGKCGAVRLDRQIGLEPSVDEYVARMVQVFRDVWRVLRNDGVVFLNLGDSYAGGKIGRGDADIPSGDQLRRGERGHFPKAEAATEGSRNHPVPDGLKPKDLIGIPWRVALALQADGWWLRSDIIWSKPNPMPESVTDRPTKAHEYIFLLTKAERYFYDAAAIRERHKALLKIATWDERKAAGAASGSLFNGHNASHGNGVSHDLGNSSGANKRSVWEVATVPFPYAHFATFPPKLVEPCILAGTSQAGCCPACGSPWQRVVEREGGHPTSRAARGMIRDEGSTCPNGRGSRSNLTKQWAGPAEYHTRGWRPSCSCPASDPQPCLVLDPFNGSGTTGAVATFFGRSYVGLDLSADYLAMAEARIADALRPVSRLDVPPPRPSLPGQRSLFDLVGDEEDVAS